MRNNKEIMQAKNEYFTVLQPEQTAIVISENAQSVVICQADENANLKYKRVPFSKFADETEKIEKNAQHKVLKFILDDFEKACFLIGFKKDIGLVVYEKERLGYTILAVKPAELENNVNIKTRTDEDIRVL